MVDKISSCHDRFGYHVGWNGLDWIGLSWGWLSLTELRGTELFWVRSGQSNLVGLGQVVMLDWVMVMVRVEV